MNTYNENLHSSVLTSLESQQLGKKQLDSQLNASMFTLYYAEGAEIVANEKLDATTKMYEDKQHINSVAVKNKNMSDNLLLSANQQKTYTSQSVNNVAVAAANIQVATNAIVRLASDVGSIFSIINAADYGSQIYRQSEEVYSLMNKTAYNAELTSQQAMEASASIAEVTSGVVADEAKVTSDSVNSLLQVTTADLTAITAILTADNDTKSQASMTTRSAEGAIKCSKVEYEAAKKAYDINNKNFNQNLVVTVPVPFDSVKKTFTVSFDPFKSPFSFRDAANQVIKDPVRSYNIIIVKESKKSFFTISTAEDLLRNSSQYFRVPTPSNPDQELKAVIAMENLLDSDNQAIVLGEKYVAFLLIQFTEDYKKEINTFDDYLSVASESFKLTHTLHKADKPVRSKIYDYEFKVKKDALVSDKNIDYRFILLPYPDDLLTNEDLTTLEDKTEILQLNETIELFDNEINKLSQEVDNLNANIKHLTAELAKDPKNAAAKQNLSNFKNSLAEANTRLSTAKNQQKAKKEELAEVEKNYPKPIQNSGAFFFNLTLAENVPAGSYISAVPAKGEKAENASFDTYDVNIDGTTTDNFGNPLVDQKQYIPVVLSYFNGNKINSAQYSNNLSDWENTDLITYNLKS